MYSSFGKKPGSSETTRENVLFSMMRSIANEPTKSTTTKTATAMMMRLTTLPMSLPFAKVLCQKF